MAHPLTDSQIQTLFPTQVESNSDTLKAHLAAVRFTQNANPETHFELSAPAAFQWIPPAPAEHPPLVTLKSPTTTARIQVFHNTVVREIAPADWTQIFLQERGHQVIHCREQVTPLGLMSDVLSATQTPHGSVFARTNTAKAGTHLYTLTCEAPDNEFPELAQSFFITLGTFHLLHPTKQALAEQLRTFSYLYPAILGFAYPESWGLAEEVQNSAECLVRLADIQGDRALGNITVHALAGASPRRLFAQQTELWAAHQIEFDSVPDLTPAPPTKLFQTMETAHLSGRGPRGPISAAVCVLQNEVGHLLIALDGPSKAHSPFASAVHRRAFELVRDTAYLI
ncbi:MAG: hypothetical protein IPK82_39355 [Polyangiaceae bacterium]|nr:hypothetical protein [Polyangiaceae bacterium]